MRDKCSSASLRFEPRQRCFTYENSRVLPLRLSASATTRRALQDRARRRIAVSPTAQMPIHHRVILDAFVACHPAKGFSSHGCGGARPGAKVGNGVAVGAGVAVAAGLCVATCACAPAKKATKPTRTHTLRKGIPDRIRVLVAGCRS